MIPLLSSLVASAAARVIEEPPTPHHGRTDAERLARHRRLIAAGVPTIAGGLVAVPIGAALAQDSWSAPNDSAGELFAGLAVTLLVAPAALVTGVTLVTVGAVECADDRRRMAVVLGSNGLSLTARW